MIIELIWPHKDLSPNSRKNWRNRAHKAKVHRAASFALTLQAIRQSGFVLLTDHKAITVSMRFIPPANRAHDRDNLVSRMKSSLDGIADALAVNDFRFALGEVVLEPAQKPGKVLVTIQEAA